MLENHDRNTFAPGAPTSARLQTNAAFVGSELVFSQQSIRTFAAEFPALAPIRLASLADLTLFTQMQGDLALVFVAEAHADALMASFDNCQRACKGARIILAFDDPQIATNVKAFFEERGAGDALGLLPMKRPLDCWLAIIALLITGDVYTPPELPGQARPLLPRAQPADVVAQVDENTLVDVPEDAKNKDQDTGPLTDREFEVLGMVALGKQNKIIADYLSVSEHTVKLHIHNIIRKLGVSNRTAASAWYHASGFVAAKPEAQENPHG